MKTRKTNKTIIVQIILHITVCTLYNVHAACNTQIKKIKHKDEKSAGNDAVH